MSLVRHLPPPVLRPRWATRCVGQFHHVVEIPLLIPTPDVQDLDLTFVRAGDWLELADAAEFSLIRTLVVEGVPIHHFHRAVSSHDVPRQPHLAVTAATNHSQGRVVGDHGGCPLSDLGAAAARRVWAGAGHHSASCGLVRCSGGSSTDPDPVFLASTLPGILLISPCARQASWQSPATSAAAPSRKAAGWSAARRRTARRARSSGPPTRGPSGKAAVLPILPTGRLSLLRCPRSPQSRPLGPISSVPGLSPI